MNSRILGGATGKIELPSTEMGKNAREIAFGHRSGIKFCTY